MVEQKLIVGVDPGTTSAVSILSLSGKLLELRSGKKLSEKKIIKLITSNGNASVVATDRTDAPSLVRSIATSLDAKLFEPERNLSIKKKEELTRKYELANSHQRDALAASLTAWKSFRGKLCKLDEKISSLGLQRYSDKIKDLVIRKEKSLAKAIELVLGRKERKAERDQLARREQLERELSAARSYCSRLEKRIKELSYELKAKKGRAIKPSSKLKARLKKEQKRSKCLREELEFFRSLEKVRKKGRISVKILPLFKRSEFERFRRKFGPVDKDVVCFRSSIGAESTFIDTLLKAKPKAVIADLPTKIANELEKELPLIPPKLVDLTKESEYVGSLDCEEYKEAREKVLSPSEELKSLIK